MKQRLGDYSFEVKKQQEHKIVAVIIFFLIIFTGISLIRMFLLFPVRQNAASMQPDIPSDSCVMFTPILGTISRGDVVLLKAQEAEQLSPFLRALNGIVGFFTAQQYVPFGSYVSMGASGQIRRVVALPGDTIYMRGFIVFVQPAGERHFLTEFELVEHTSYNVNIVSVPRDWDSEIGVGGSFEQRTLKEDEYFVLGDNRTSAIDSRLWGTISLHDIQAKGLAVYFPFSKMRLL
ncbi:MAG: signal peptidase I [Treponema sp.]|nr:signal peptidase I [Treponema sp.]